MPDRLQEIRARLDAATPGPWKADRHEVLTVVVQPDTGWELCVADVWDDDDADMIAHAPADIAWLLAENEAFREQIQFLRDDIRRVREYAHHRDGCAAIADADAIHDTPCDCGLEVEDA